MSVHVVFNAQRVLVLHLKPVSDLLTNLERSDERFHLGLNTIHCLLEQLR